MAVAVNQIGQIALGVADVDAAEAFCAGKLGLRKLFRFGDMAFFDCAGVRLLLEKTRDGTVKPGSRIYFKVADIALARRELEARGVVFVDEIHMIAPMEDHDLWMTFFKDPDGNLLALMCEMPEGFKPV